eukprot:Clim_evm5s141 gene=Clim_evmTU5s141
MGQRGSKAAVERAYPAAKKAVEEAQKRAQQEIPKTAQEWEGLRDTYVKEVETEQDKVHKAIENMESKGPVGSMDPAKSTATDVKTSSEYKDVLNQLYVSETEKIPEPKKAQDDIGSENNIDRVSAAGIKLSKTSVPLNTDDFDLGMENPSQPGKVTYSTTARILSVYARDPDASSAMKLARQYNLSEADARALTTWFTMPIFTPVSDTVVVATRRPPPRAPIPRTPEV